MFKLNKKIKNTDIILYLIKLTTVLEYVKKPHHRK